MRSHGSLRLSHPGHSREIELYEVLDVCPDRKLREETRRDFEDAVERLLHGEFEAAAKGFAAVRRRNPGDLAAAFQLEAARSPRRA